MKTTEPAPGGAQPLGGVAQDHYRKLNQREHVLEKPEMYGCSPERTQREAWLYDFGTGRMVRAAVTTPAGVERLFLEILSNALDEHYKARRAGLDPGDIAVTMNERQIQVTSGGRGIAVEIHRETGVYNPQLIFGMFRSGSNYEPGQVRMWCGTNGLGAKLTNVFSSQFSVEVNDPRRRLAYFQEWRDNMRDCSKPEIVPYEGSETLVSVIYELDFARFGYAGGYTDDEFRLFARHAADMAFNAHNRIVFNQITFDFAEIRDYAKLYFDEALIAKALPLDIEYDVETKQGPAPLTLEGLVFDTPDAAEIVSFANGMATPKGGAHVEAVVKAVSDEVLAKLRPSGRTSGSRHPTPPSARLTLADVRPHVSAIVCLRCPDPKIDSNSKEFLVGPKPRVELGKEEAKVLRSWDLMERLVAQLQAKDYRRLASTDGKKKRFIGSVPGENANFAGGPRSHECTLFLVEGESATSYAGYAIDNIEGGHDFVGYFPLRGKPLNVTCADVEQVLDNAEIANLKKVLGLREGVGTNGGDYVKDEEYRTLRYGRIVIMADADDDGKHITALVINLFYNFYRGLLQRGAVYFLRSPIIRVKRGREKQAFFTEPEYELWKEQTPDAKLWKPKYLKGLGSSNADDAAEDFQDPHFVECFYDDATPETIRLAFDPKLANERKAWIGRWQRFLGAEELVKQPISQFINRELILYCLRSIKRAIPSLLDGFKDSQRKILEGMRRHWGTKAGLWPDASFDGAGEKVVVFASEVTTATNYRHGPTSLEQAIFGMGSPIVGIQNLPFLFPDGNFGSRVNGPKIHAAPRYPFAYPESWVRAVFRNEDFPILPANEDEGKLIEPHHFLPVVPLCVINGAEGVATGWATFVPCHNPKDVVKWLRARIAGERTPRLLPWYRDFTGRISLERVNLPPAPAAAGDCRRLSADAADLAAGAAELEDGAAAAPEPEKPGLEPDEVGVVDGELSMVTQGVFTSEIVSGRRGEMTKVHITELPLRRWTNSYTQWLEQLASKKNIRDFQNHCTITSVDITVLDFEKPTIERLRLKKSFGLSNMILLDEGGYPQRFRSAADIMEAFYQARLPWYEKRKQHQVGVLRKEIERLRAKIHFIDAVNSGELVIRERSTQDVKAQMARLRIPDELFEHVTVASLAKDKLAELSAKLAELSEKLKTYETRSPGQLWLADLDDFEKAYAAWLADLGRREQRNKTRGGRKAKAAEEKPAS
jgi:DNA topoisomerase-2